MRMLVPDFARIFERAARETLCDRAPNAGIVLSPPVVTRDTEAVAADLGIYSERCDSSKENYELPCVEDAQKCLQAFFSAVLYQLSYLATDFTLKHLQQVPKPCQIPPSSDLQ